MEKQRLPFTFDRILLHEDFIRYIESNRSNPENPWKKEFEKNPDLKQEFERAVQLHRMLTSHKRIKYPDDYKRKQINRLFSRINAETKSDRFNQRRNLIRISQISASILIALIVAAILLIRNNVIDVSLAQVKELRVIVPSGEKSQLILPDGTQVWLNSESKLVYPCDFTSRERKVTLEGEAYFEVAKVNHSQFIVFTQDFKIRVLGTKFNIKSYPKDRAFETTVVEGMVRVESGKPILNFSPVVLKPTERLVYKKDTGSDPNKTAMDTESASGVEKVQVISNKEIIISHVNTNHITCWKDHLLVFDNETFEEIARKMSRWYKVEITLLDEELKTQRYTGKFVHNESLTQVLEAIRLTTPINYQINQNRVEIALSKNNDFY